MTVTNVQHEQAIRAAFFGTGFGSDAQPGAPIDKRQLSAAAVATLEAYGDEVMSFLCSRLPRGDAQEVFSMMAEDMWTGLPNFGWRCSMRTWLYTLARNALVRFVQAPQHRAARNLGISQLDELSVLVERVRSATDLPQQTAVKDRFKELCEELDEEDRTLLLLRIDRGLSFRELALTLSGNVELDEASIEREAARLRKAFARLKEQLRERAERAGLLQRD